MGKIAEDIKKAIKVIKNDYYYSNPIARASITMSNCRSEKIKFIPTGTEG